MSNDVTNEDTVQKYINLMGEQLGKEFHSLLKEVTWLYVKWHEYVTLYGTKTSRIDLMKRAAPMFFRIVQDSLFEGTILHMTRLTDPPSLKGNDNLSIKRLPKLLSDQKLKKDVEAKIEIATQKSKFCRDWRNRRFAHFDLKLAIEEGTNPLEQATWKKVQETLDSIADVLKIVHHYYTDGGSLIFDPLISSYDSESLLYIINDGLKFDEERRKRIQSGNIREDDFKARDIRL